LFLIFSGSSGNARSGVMVKVRTTGVQTQEFLSAFPPLEPLLTSLLSPSGAVFLLDDVGAPGRGDHLLVIDAS
jgi:hypothetical protein